MPWLRPFALFLVFFTARLRPAAAEAFSSSADANAQPRVGTFEVVAGTLVGGLGAASRELHEGVGGADDENASGDRLAAEGRGVLVGANFAQKSIGCMFRRGGAFAGRSVDDIAAERGGNGTAST